MQHSGIHSIRVGDVVVTALNDGQFQASTAILNGVEYGLMSPHYGYNGYNGPYGKKYGNYRYGEDDASGGGDAKELEGEENRAA